jgi:hypothetical protein
MVLQLQTTAPAPAPSRHGWRAADRVLGHDNGAYRAWTNWLWTRPRPWRLTTWWTWHSRPNFRTCRSRSSWFQARDVNGRAIGTFLRECRNLLQYHVISCTNGNDEPNTRVGYFSFGYSKRLFAIYFTISRDSCEGSIFGVRGNRPLPLPYRTIYRCKDFF